MGDFFTDAAGVVGAIASPVSAVINAINTGDNNRESRELAQRENAIARDFARSQSNWSADQAAIQREFQREMANTAHQRQAEDLRKAGLNPILAANNGAPSPVGASGSAASASSQGIPKGDSINLGNAVSAATSSAQQMIMFRKDLEAKDAAIQLDKAAAVAKVAEADSASSSAKQQRALTQQVLKKMPALDAEIKRDIGQAQWDTDLQAYDNLLQRFSKGAESVLQLLNPMNAIRRAYPGHGSKEHEWFQKGRDSVTGRTMKGK